MADIKAYQPESSSVGAGQVLHSPYSFEKAELVVKEMADSLALDLVDRGLVTSQLVLMVGYDVENLSKGRGYQGDVMVDMYGRRIPKHARGTVHLERKTSSARLITEAVQRLYHDIVDETLLVRRVNLTACQVEAEHAVDTEKKAEQLNLFFDYEAEAQKQAEEEDALEREKRKQQAILEIRKKYGKNAILKGMSLEEGATMAERNRQIGGHKA